MPVPAILETQNLTGAVRKFKFPEEFITQKPELAFLFPDQPIEGDHAEIDVLENTNQAPKYVSRGGQSITRALTSRSQIKVRMPYIKDSFLIPSDTLNNLRGLGTSKSMRAVEYISEELEENARRIVRAKEVAKFKALSTAFQLVIDNTLYTIESPYHADNTPDVSGTAPWSTVTTDIRGAVKGWNAITVQKTGRSLNFAMLNSKTMGYVLHNDFVSGYLKGTDRGVQLVEGIESYNLFGITWIVWDQYYTDPFTGASVMYIPDETVIFVPGTADWSEYQIGETAYINDAGEEAIDHGPVAYTVMNEDPVGRKCFSLFCGLPVVKIPDAVIIAKVA